MNAGQQKDVNMAGRSVTVYGSQAQQLAIAQQVLDEHVTSSGTGRCLKCGAPGPCFRRETAVAVWSRSRQLPRRIPGLSRPELINAKQVNAAGALWASGSWWAL